MRAGALHVVPYRLVECSQTVVLLLASPCFCPNQVATAGSPLRGTVELEAKKPFKASRIALRMYGKEKTNISGKARVQDSCECATVQAGSERRFFAVAMDLQGPDWGPGKMNPAGSYSFPFEIDLPADLPPSVSNLTARFKSITGNKEGFRVQYKLTASIPRKFKKVEWTSVDTKSTTEIIEVRARPQPAEPHVCMIQPVVQDLKGIVLSKGSVTFGACIEDSELTPGENLCLSMACTNNSTADIKKVSIELVEHLDWEAKFAENQSKSILRRVAEVSRWIYNETFGEGNKTYYGHDSTFEQFEESVLFKIGDVDLPGLDQDRKTRDDVRESKKEKASTFSQDCQTIFTHLNSGKNRMDIKVPLETRMSYSGRLVKVSHFLKISLQTKMFVSDACLFIPIRITAPPEVTKQAPPVPQLTPAPPVLPLSTDPSNDDTEAIDTSSAADESPAITMPTDSSKKQALGLLTTKFQAPLVKADPEHMFVGKEAQYMVGKKPVIEWILPSEVLQQRREPNMSNLYRFMQESINPSDLLERRTRDPAWASFFGSLSADDFGRIVAWIPSNFDRPRAAVLLAPFLNGATGMRCGDAAAAIRSTGSWNRATLVQKILPLCQDVDENENVIVDALNEWEEMVVYDSAGGLYM